MLLYLAQRHQVHLFTFAEEADTPSLDALKQLLAGVTAAPYHNKRKGGELDLRLPGGFTPDVIHVQGTSMLPFRPPKTPYVLELHDIPSLLEAQLSALSRGASGMFVRWRRLWRAWALGKIERRATQSASAVILTSEEDRKAFQERAGGPNLEMFVLPNGIDLAEWSLVQDLPEPATILFPAALNWAPNVDAVKVLVRQLLPEVRSALRHVRLMIAGRRPARAVRTLVELDPAVTLVPDPQRMQPLFNRATVVAVPLRAATGTRLKILQALACGRAVVSTPVGARGLDLLPGQDLFVAGLVQPFAEALVELLESEVSRRALQSSGWQSVQKYAWRHHLPILDQVYRP
jgi:glycosyltransferase involved in cell wall biosynthesis